MIWEQWKKIDLTCVVLDFVKDKVRQVQWIWVMWKVWEKIWMKLFFKKYFIYLFLERGEGREKERERNINVWLPLVRPLRGTWPSTQACALTGNRTSDPLVWRPALNPLTHISQDWTEIFTSQICYKLSLPVKEMLENIDNYQDD